MPALPTIGSGIQRNNVPEKSAALSVLEKCDSSVQFVRATGRTFLVTSLGRLPGSGTSTTVFGTYGYSYHVAARRFEPILAKLGEVVWLDRPESRLEFAIHKVQSEGKEPIALAFQAFQDHFPCRSAPDVIYLFWEFPDVTDEPLLENPRYVWPQMARSVDLILTASTSAAETLGRAGVRTPVRVVPVPVPEEWFAVPPWGGPKKVELTVLGQEVNAVWANPMPAPPAPLPPAPPNAWPRRAFRKTRLLYSKGMRPLVPPVLDHSLTSLARACKRALTPRPQNHVPLPPAPTPPPPKPTLRLSGIVYTMVLQPGPRKALRDLMTAFVWALRDRSDAVLVLRIISEPKDLPAHLEEIRSIYRSLSAIPHQCRIVVLTDPMSEEQMRELTALTTYYVNATKAEGACLPLMEMLAAGRPGLSPIHTAMGDYFDASVGFVIESHPEPCPFPGDYSQRLRTTCHRLVWQSLRDQFQASYALAHDREAYGALAMRARQRMRDHCGTERVTTLLKEALPLVEGSPTTARKKQPLPSRQRQIENRSRRSPPQSPVYIDISTMLTKEMTGIGRYVTHLVHALSRSTEVRLIAPFPQSQHGGSSQPSIPPGPQEIVLKANSILQPWADLGAWRDAVLQQPKQPHSEAHARHCACIFPWLKLPWNRFGREIGIIHDLSPFIMPHTATAEVRQNFLNYLHLIPRHDAIVCVSKATRRDVAWLTGIDSSALHVAYNGPSVCVNGHLYDVPVERSPRMMLAVSAHHPRKNGDFLLHWFLNTAILPSGMELWWAGPDPAKSLPLVKSTSNPFGRQVRLLGMVSDEQLCRLYKEARCLVYPSLYEGFGFPVLDALLHGTPVLCGRHSSLVEFEGLGVFYFDPCCAQSVDRAFQDLCHSQPVEVQRNDLRERCSWERVAKQILELCD